MAFIDPRLPALVRGDAGRIRQVLINLVGNAVKFTSHGSVTLTVDAQTAEHVQFSVVDTGMGMAADGRHSQTQAIEHSVLFGLRVLLAEDNAVNQRVACKQLEHFGCQVVVVPDGRQAVARASEDRFDLVLMDCHRPEMDGFSAARAIRAVEAQNNTRTPIIALTAGAMEQDRLACLAAGMDDYLSKPINAEALRATIARWTTRGTAV